MAACVTSSIAGVLNSLEKLNEFALAVQMCGSGQSKYTCGITSMYSNRCTSATCVSSSQERPSLDLGGDSCTHLTQVQGDHQKRRLRLHLRHHLRPLVPLPARPEQLLYNTSPLTFNSPNSLSCNSWATNNVDQLLVAPNTTTSSPPSSSSSSSATRSCNSHHSHNNSTHHQVQASKYPHYSSLLVSWIIILVFSTTTLIPTMAAPIGSPSTTPKWVNPCGVNPDQVLGSHEVEMPPLKPSQLYNNIALQAKLAKEQADEVSPQYVLEAFQDPHFPVYAKELSYKWLPVIPEPSSDHIEGMQAEEALRSSYEYLQFYAVGLEQIVLDQIVYEGMFLDEFRQMEGKLRQVLCEIQLAMLEMKFKQNSDVTREVMAQEFRDMDSKTARDLRDWIILRDYIGALNYISTVFAHFKSKADAQEG